MLERIITPEKCQAEGQSQYSGELFQVTNELLNLERSKVFFPRVINVSLLLTCVGPVDVVVDPVHGQPVRRHHALLRHHRELGVARVDGGPGKQNEHIMEECFRKTSKSQKSELFLISINL